MKNYLIKTFFAIIFIVLAINTNAQNVVKDINAVKKPILGRLYYSKKDSTLNLWAGFWQQVNITKKTIEEPPTVIVPPVLPISEIELGYWEKPERILISKIIGNEYFLMQTDAQRTYYVARGINLISDKRTKIISESNLQNIKSNNSDLGGLLKPNNFPEDKFLNLGFEINSKGEYVKKGTENKPTDDNNQQSDIKDISLKETTIIKDNTFDWMQFESLKLPKNHNMVLGYGSPIYNSQLKNEKLPYLDAGWTHAVNIERLPMKFWTNSKNGQLEAKNTYYFQQYSHLVNRAAQSAYNWWNRDWGDISGLWNGQNYGLDYSRINDEGALVIGKIIGGNNSVARNNETGQWNVKTIENYLMMDEEEYFQYPNYWRFMGKVAQGITESNSNLNVMLYGPPASYFIHNNNWSENISNEKIENQLKNGDFTFNTDGFLKSKTIFDLSMGYYKVPGIETNSKYEKINGNYVIQNGKRVYNKKDFEESYFNRKVQILSEPHEWLKYSLKLKDASKADPSKGIYPQLFGKQYFENINSIKPEYRELYKYNGVPQSDWKSESELAVRQEYKYVNGVLMKMLIINRVEFKDYNLNIYRDRNLKFGVVRRWRTEPFTTYGNHIDRREIGPDLVFWDVAFSLVSGITTIEAWEDGLYLNTLPESGNILYGESDNFGRYEVATKAMQRVMKPFENLPVENTRYLHFYMPFVGENNSEAIVAARYNGNKMVLVARNPTLDPDEKQILILKLKDKVYQFELQGNKTKLLELTIDENLKPEETSLEQTNIYGKKIKTSGVSTWEISKKYLK